MCLFRRTTQTKPIQTFFTLPWSDVAVSPSRVLRVFIRCFRELCAVAVAVGLRVRAVPGRGSVAASLSWQRDQN